MNNLFHSIGHIFLVAALSVSTAVAPHTIHKPTSHLVKIHHEVSNKNVVKLKGKIAVDGYSLALNLSYPKDGGQIEGIITGTCNGKVTGTYSNSNNKINGIASGTCSLGFIHVPGTINFNGTIDPKTNITDLSYNATSTGFSKSGTIELTLSN